MAVITGNGGVITGTNDPDTITNTGAATASTINGLAGNDTLQGNTGDDSLNGGSGADVMIGGTGVDIYVVDDAGDQVVENAGDNGDQVQATLSYVLAAGVSIEVLTANVGQGAAAAPAVGTGTANINLTGNEQAQSGNLTIAGVGGIYGNAGNNILDGGVDQVAANGNVTEVADNLIGGVGNDTYIVRNSTDTVTEAANEGVDTVFVAPSQLAAAPNGVGFVQSFTLAANQSVEVLAALTATGTERIDLAGNALAQTIQGNNGANSIVGGVGTGVDTLAGLGGNDTYVIGNTASVLLEADGQGADALQITAGTTQTATGGVATTFTLAAGVSIENVTILGAADFNFTGNEFNQFILGNATGANAIDGGTGDDTMIGLSGSDTYTVNSAGDVVVEDDTNALGFQGGGTGDRINSSISYILSGTQNIEVLAAGTTAASAVSDQDGSFSLNGISAASGDRFLVGNTFAQVIIGSSGANTLDGNRDAGAVNAADTLAGLAGDDIYRVYGQDDVVLEDSNGGFDRIFTSATYSLVGTTAANSPISNISGIAGVGTLNAGAAAFYQSGQAEIELLSTASNAGTTAINLTGNGFGQIIVGNFGVNNISGGYGAFTTAGDPTTVPTRGGTAFGGVDVLIGLNGNDNYTVTSSNTFVFEEAGATAGTADVVNVDARFVSSFTLNGGSYVETLQTLNAAGAEAIALVGNEQQQLIVGNVGNNTLSGGGFGAGDTLDGGAGNDTYRVFNGNDTIQDSAGSDSIFASGVSYQLGNAVSVEYISAAVQGAGDQIFLVGNEISQVIVGNFGDNTLDGNRRANGQAETTLATTSDTLVGLFGSDTYRVYGNNNDGNGGALLGAGNTGDVVIEQAGAGGYDQVFASGNYQLRDGTEVEALSASSQTATAATAQYILRGNGFAQLVVGNDTANTLDGRAGNDTLIGRGGNDVFAFTTALDAVTNVDQIIDFAAGDRIGLSNDNNVATNTANEIFANAVFDANSVLTQTDFQVVTTGQGTNGGAHIIYNSATGQLFYDADGTGFGGSVLFAQLAVGTQLGFNDIIAQPLVVGLPAI